MAGTDVDQQIVKRLKKRRLLQNNIQFLIGFIIYGLLFLYARQVGSAFVLVFVFSLFSWSIAVHSLYMFKTGKIIGTKTARLMVELDKERVGEEEWKQQRVDGMLGMGIIGIVSTLCLFLKDLQNVELEFLFFIPILAAWVVHNILEGYKIKKL